MSWCWCHVLGNVRLITLISIASVYTYGICAMKHRHCVHVYIAVHLYIPGLVYLGGCWVSPHNNDAYITESITSYKEGNCTEKQNVANNSCDVPAALHWMLSNRTIERTRIPFSNISFSHFAVSFPGLVPCFIDGQFIDMAGSFSGGWVATYKSRKRSSLGHMGKPSWGMHSCAQAAIRSTW